MSLRRQGTAQQGCLLHSRERWLGDLFQVSYLCKCKRTSTQAVAVTQGPHFWHLLSDFAYISDPGQHNFIRRGLLCQ